MKGKCSWSLRSHTMMIKSVGIVREWKNKLTPRESSSWYLYKITLWEFLSHWKEKFEIQQGFNRSSELSRSGDQAQMVAWRPGGRWCTQGAGWFPGDRTHCGLGRVLDRLVGRGMSPDKNWEGAFTTPRLSEVVLERLWWYPWIPNVHFSPLYFNWAAPELIHPEICSYNRTVATS